MGIQEMYKQWNLQGFIILSLSLQVFLLLFSPLRKRISKWYFTFPVWLAFLQADIVSTYVLNLIATSDQTRKAKNQLLVLWAPFLLTHLGSFDTITSYAFQDNELWHRHLFLFSIKLGFCVFSFATLGTPHNTIWAPVIFVFIVGIIKYSERIKSLYLASPFQLREASIRKPDPGSTGFRLLRSHQPPKPSVEIHWRISKWKSLKEGNVQELHEPEIIQIAYIFLQSFKGLVADLSLSLEDAKISRSFFLQVEVKSVFKIIETELNLLHDIVHTKVKAFGVISRLSSFVLLMVALFVFMGVEKKHAFSSSDVGITYSLFVGAISLDVLSFIMLVYSDWGAIALIAMSDGDDQSRSSKVLTLLHPSWFSYNKVAKPRQRWSESIPQYNLIQNSLKRDDWSSSKWTIKINNIIDEKQQVKTKRFDLKIGETIFYVLHKIASMPVDLKKPNDICLARGSWLLEKETDLSWIPRRKKLVEYIKDIEYEESIILWHVATNICYFTFEDENSQNENLNLRESCMVISNYMVYLLLKDPTMISAMAGTGQLIYGDTKAALEQMIHTGRPESQNSKEVCVDILNLESTKTKRMFHGIQIDAGIRKGRDGKFSAGFEARMKKDDENDENKSKSVLMKAKELAEKLREFNAPERWEVMSEVWVGIMIHAASGCKATNHVGQLAKGGQLITIVWLLMAHLGLGMHFMENERATLPERIGHIDLTKGQQQQLNLP